MSGSHRPAVFVQALLGTLVVGLVYALGRSRCGTRVGLVAALLAALNPTYIFHEHSRVREFVAWCGWRWSLAGRRRVAADSPRGAGVGRYLRDLLLVPDRLRFGNADARSSLVPPVALASRARVDSRRAWLIGSACLVGAVR
jgi:hypothetical protein